MCDSPRTGCAWWTTRMWREQAEIKWARRGIFIVAGCNNGKLCAHASLPFQSQQSGSLTRVWRSWQVQPSQKRTCNRCGSLQKWREVVGTIQLMLHWKCGFRVLNTWKWPDMNMYLYLNLATFQYIDGLGCYHFLLNRIGLKLIIFVWSSQLSFQFRDCRLLWTAG